MAAQFVLNYSRQPFTPDETSYTSADDVAYYGENNVKGTLWERVNESGDWESPYFTSIANRRFYSRKIALAFNRLTGRTR